MQLDSTLSDTARPFQPQATPQSSQEDDVPRTYPVRHGLAGSSPTLGFTTKSPVGRPFPSHRQSSDDDGVSTDMSISDGPSRRRCGSRRSRGSRSGSDSDGTHSSGGKRKKKDGFSSKIQIPEFGGKKGHAHDVASAFKLMDKELQSLQYEVSLNGVQEEIRHVLDSVIAKNGGKLTPQQMYEAIKRYKTYVAHNKRLEGKGASLSASQLKAAGHTSGYKLQFLKTTAFAATITESEDDGPGRHEFSSQEGANPYGDESSQEDDEGLFIPSYLEEALPDDPVLQVKMARAMLAQEVETRRCFTCNQQGHLQRDHWKYEEKNRNGPLQPKGPPLNKSAQERVKTKPPPPG